MQEECRVAGLPQGEAEREGCVVVSDPYSGEGKNTFLHPACREQVEV